MVFCISISCMILSLTTWCKTYDTNGDIIINLICQLYLKKVEQRLTLCYFDRTIDITASEQNQRFAASTYKQNPSWAMLNTADHRYLCTFSCETACAHHQFVSNCDYFALWCLLFFEFYPEAFVSDLDATIGDHYARTFLFSYQCHHHPSCRQIHCRNKLKVFRRPYLGLILTVVTSILLDWLSGCDLAEIALVLYLLLMLSKESIRSRKSDCAQSFRLSLPTPHF